MDRGASSFASMATEDRSKIARTSPPWQGMRMLVAAPQIVFGAIIKFNNYHSQGMSKAKPAECRRVRSPENRLQPPSAKHERRGGSPAAAGRFFDSNKIQQLPFSRHEQSASCGMPQSEVSGKSTATAECVARAARRLSRRRREIF